MKKDYTKKDIARISFGKPRSTDKLLNMLGYIKVKGGYIKK